MISKIVISNDFESLKTEFENTFKQNVRFFISDDFLIENAQAVIKEAYIAEKDEKMLVIMAKSFRIEAQNSILKILEEPPRNIFFTIVSPSKNLLLPTIRSRLSVTNLVKKSQRVSSGLNLKQLDLKEIYTFLDEILKKEQTDEIGKNELKELVGVIIFEAINLGFKFSQDELEYFYKLIHLCDLNAKSPQILTPLLLTILRKGRV